MTLHEEQEKVQKAMNAALSGLQEDPWLTRRVLANAKGEKPVKRKISLALVLSVILALAIGGTAYALSSSQVAEFFGRYWNKDLGDWLAGGKVAQIGETVSLGGVDFTLNEVVYRDRGVYGVGTARVKDEKDVLLPMDMVDGWELEEVSQGEEAQALIRKARDAGGRMLSIDCYPAKIGVDGGSMVNTGDVGVYNLRNEDGSIAFSFETGGYALEDGATYQLALSIDVDEWTEAGMVKEDQVKPQIWTVSFEPVIVQDAQGEGEPVQISLDTVQQSGYEILVPPQYEETGTLPVYRAIENDFTETVKPEWFNQSGIARKESAGSLEFNDHAVLQYSQESIWYAEYSDELFDYNWRERETYAPDIGPMMLPRQALSMGIAQIASSVYFGHGISSSEVTLEREQLPLISLDSAKRTAEALFEKLGLRGFELAWALDMSLDRIQSLGEKYNRYWFEGEGGYSNAPRQDYTAAAAEDEGYFLYYTPLGVTRISDGRHQATLFVNSRGIVYASIVSEFRRSEAAYTPSALISAQEAVERLYTEIAHSRDGRTVQSIERAALTYVAVRAENKKDGMVFAPVWQILFRETGKGNDYDCWAEFNAVSGTMIDAIFR